MIRQSVYLEAAGTHRTSSVSDQAVSIVKHSVHIQALYSKTVDISQGCGVAVGCGYNQALSPFTNDDD